MSTNSTYSTENSFSSYTDSSPEEKQYYYSYSYLYNWIKIKENNDLVFTFDEDSLMKLTTIFFEVKLPNTHRKFERKQIKSLSVKKKKLILPLLLGGIVAPLSVIAAASYSLSMLTGLSLFLGSAFLFYYGYVGNYQIEVKFFNGTQNQFFVDGNVSDLQKFIVDCHQQIYKRNVF
ncbi:MULTISPECIES: hypothetical protein [Flammeovirga]|uniref:Uncharacterized protein n=1 Tax=Flammeovirga agarivorans TaxID=2726742 RepID=A0A7X8SMJ4_9BACT|nr:MULTISPECIES: hypothetical protein [Flammeovirga]NLR92920.1 hypothetical protein [Flammeovirga agarivorans]